MFTNKLTPEEEKKLEELGSTLKAVSGLNVRRVGSWLWIDGETKENRGVLKKLGCHFAPKKKMWYWRLPSQKVYYRRPKIKTYEEIVQKYGEKVL